MKLSGQTVTDLSEAVAVYNHAEYGTSVDFVPFYGPHQMAAAPVIPESWQVEIRAAIRAIAERRLAEAEAKAREELGA